MRVWCVAAVPINQDRPELARAETGAHDTACATEIESMKLQSQSRDPGSKGSGGWPSTTGQPSGGGRDNAPPGGSSDDDDDDE